MEKDMLFRVMIGEDDDDYVFQSDLFSLEEAKRVKEAASTWLKPGAYLYIEKYEKGNPLNSIRI